MPTDDVVRGGEAAWALYCSQSTLYRVAGAGDLPHWRLPTTRPDGLAHRRFRLRDLYRYAASRGIPTDRVEHLATERGVALPAANVPTGDGRAEAS